MSKRTKVGGASTKTGGARRNAKADARYGLVADFAVKLAKDPDRWEEPAKLFLNRQTPFEVSHPRNWFDHLSAAHEARLSWAFDKRIVVDRLPKSATKELLEAAGRCGLRLIFLPDEEIGADHQTKVRRWDSKPERRFYELIRDGKLPPESIKLQRGWYLADLAHVERRDGRTLIVDDPFAWMLETLAKKGNFIWVAEQMPKKEVMRYGISRMVWKEIVLPALHAYLGSEDIEVRFERAVEFSAIANVYDPHRIEFDRGASQWLDDTTVDGQHLISGGVLSFSSELIEKSDDDVTSFGRVLGRPLIRLK